MKLTAKLLCVKIVLIFVFIFPQQHMKVISKYSSNIVGAKTFFF